MGYRRVFAVQEQIYLVHVIHGDVAVSGKGPHLILYAGVVGDESQRILGVVVEDVIDISVGYLLRQPVARQFRAGRVDRLSFRQEHDFFHSVLIEEALEDLVLDAHDREIGVGAVVRIVEDHQILGIRRRFKIAVGFHHVVAAADLVQEVLHGPLGQLRLLRRGKLLIGLLRGRFFLTVRLLLIRGRGQDVAAAASAEKH